MVLGKKGYRSRNTSKKYDIIYKQSLMQISTMDRKIYKIFTNTFYRLTCPYSPPCSSGHLSYLQMSIGCILQVKFESSVREKCLRMTKEDTFIRLRTDQPKV